MVSTKRPYRLAADRRALLFLQEAKTQRQLAMPVVARVLLRVGRPGLQSEANKAYVIKLQLCRSNPQRTSESPAKSPPTAREKTSAACSASWRALRMASSSTAPLLCTAVEVDEPEPTETASSCRRRSASRACASVRSMMSAGRKIKRCWEKKRGYTAHKYDENISLFRRTHLVLPHPASFRRCRRRWR